MASHPAVAVDGPLAGDPNLTVEELEGGDWPPTRVWTTGPGADERHLYRFKDVALTPTGAPAYEFVRTLNPDEPEP
jgi:hypothetical protein